MQTEVWSKLDEPARNRLLQRPAIAASREQSARVAEIIADVRRNGDDALIRLTREIDGIDIETLAVEPEAFEAAAARLTASRTQCMIWTIAKVCSGFRFARSRNQR